MPPFYMVRWPASISKTARDQACGWRER
jgi:hypothetical protein